MATITLATLNPLGRIEAFGSGRLAFRTINSNDSPITVLSPLHNLVVKNNLPVIEDNNTKSKMLQILSCLRAIDFCFEKKLNYKNHIYLYDDQSLQVLLALSDAPSDAWQSENLSQLLEILGCLGLIYRFNVAPKFGLDEAKMQLRLNGWGRIACDEYALEQTSAFQAAVACVTKIIEAKESKYIELLRLCNSDERPLKSDQIISIINEIPLTVVT